MTVRLDNAGIYKARPLTWTIFKSEKSKSVGINICFLVTHSLDGDEWVSWAEAEEHNVYGTYYVIGKNGDVNMTACEQLVESMGWDGSLDSIAGPVPSVIVQITVKGEEYNGKTTYKAGWMNPEDFVPTAGGATADEVADLSKSYGSLLRGAAASIAKKAKPKVAKLATPPASNDDDADRYAANPEPR